MSKKKPKGKKTPKSNSSPPNAKGAKEKIEKPKAPETALTVAGPVYSDLTDKQRKFCHEYVKDFNATQVAIRAGYSEKGAAQQGHVLLRNPKVQEYCQQLIAEQLHKAEVTDDWIIGMTREIVVKTAQQIDEPVMVVEEEEGEMVAKPTFVKVPHDGKSALKGLELLAKIKGMLKENMHHTGQMTMNMSPAEHAAMMKERVKEKYGRNTESTWRSFFAFRLFDP